MPDGTETQGTGDAAQSAGNRDGQQAGVQQTSKSFSQEELERIVGERLARERQKYADYDSIKAELGKIKQSQMSDIEKLTQAASEHERRAIAAESRIAQTEIKADFVEKAIGAGVTDIRLAYLAAQAEGLLGAYDPDKGVGKHDFDELKKRYPHLFRATTGGSADGGAGGGSKIGGDMNQWIRSAARGR